MTKTKIISTLAVCAVALAAAAPASAAATLVTSFEDQITSGTNYEYVSATQPYSGVTLPLGTDSSSILKFTGGAGLQANGSAFGFNTAPDLNQTAFIQDYNGKGGEIDIALSGLTKGQYYEITFQDADRPGYGSDPFTVSTGKFTDSYTATGTAWSSNTFDFTATGTTASLAFLGSSISMPTGDFSVGLDAVSISAVPELTTWAMMLLGFGMVGFALRRRNQTVRFATFA